MRCPGPGTIAGRISYTNSSPPRADSAAWAFEVPSTQLTALMSHFRPAPRPANRRNVPSGIPIDKRESAAALVAVPI